MYLNNFSVRVVGGEEVAGGYVEMDHGKTYQLCLRNDRALRCDARMEVDGKHVGTWRIDPTRSIILERPAHDHGKFTFYRSGSEEAAKAALDPNDPNIGLVKVTFTPEHTVRPLQVAPYIPPYTPPYVPQVPRPSWPPRYGTTTGGGGGEPIARYDSCCAPVAASAIAGCGYDAGGTGLSGHSGQEFGIAECIEYDHSQQTVIHLRLVQRRDDVVRPLTSFSTPVPPAVR